MSWKCSRVSLKVLKYFTPNTIGWHVSSSSFVTRALVSIHAHTHARNTHTHTHLRAWDVDWTTFQHTTPTCNLTLLSGPPSWVCQPCCASRPMRRRIHVSMIHVSMSILLCVTTYTHTHTHTHTHAHTHTHHLEDRGQLGGGLMDLVARVLVARVKAARHPRQPKGGLAS